MPVLVTTLDASVLIEAKTGEATAFAQLWLVHQGHLLRYVRAKRITNPEDVASQVWIDVAGSIARFEGDLDDFRAWLFTIAHRRSVDEVRKAVRRPEVLYGRTGEDRCLHDGDDVLDASGALERAIALVQELPTDIAEAVILRVVFDMDLTRIADVMHRTEGSVRVLVHRGLRKLRLQLIAADTYAASAR